MSQDRTNTYKRQGKRHSKKYRRYRRANRILFIIILALSGVVVLLLGGFKSKYEKRADDALKAFNQGIDYMDSGKYENAIKQFEIVKNKAVIEEGTKKEKKIDHDRQYELYIRALYLIGDCRYASGDTKEYEKAYLDALTQDIKETKYSRKMTGTDYLKRAMAYDMSGDDNNALKSIENGLSCDDTDAAQELMYNRIIICEKLCLWDDAKSALDEYDTLFPDDKRLEKDRVFLSTR